MRGSLSQCSALIRTMSMAAEPACFTLNWPNSTARTGPRSTMLKLPPITWPHETWNSLPTGTSSPAHARAIVGVAPFPCTHSTRYIPLDTVKTALPNFLSVLC